jgi:hypothetical protein
MSKPWQKSSNGSNIVNFVVVGKFDLAAWIDSCNRHCGAAISGYMFATKTYLQQQP